MYLRDFVGRCARSFPEKVAYVDGDRSRSWSEAHRRSDGLAAGLQRLGLRKGEVSAVLAHNGLEVVEHWFACLKTGVLRTAINWRYSVREMLHVIRDSDAKVVLIQGTCVSLLEPHLDELRKEGRHLIGFGAGHGLPLDYEALIAGGDRPRFTELGDDDLGAVAYTSGTTGFPKGVLLTQRGMREAAVHTMLQTEFQHDDVRAYVASPAGLNILGMCFNILNGMTTVLGEFHDAGQFLELVGRHKVTTTTLVPTMLRRIVEAARNGHYQTASLRHIAYGTMPASPAMVKGAFDIFGCRLVQMYGATEGTGGWFTALRDSDHRLALSSEPELLRSAGRPLLHLEVTVRDEAGGELPPGEVGEVWVAGDTLMRGYLNLPAQTDEALSGRWLRTGDLGRFDERGYLYLVDRKKFLIISGGFNVYPAVVENTLLEHPAVTEVAVVGVPHPDWGEAVVAAVALKKGKSVSPEELTAFCRGKVAKWEVPKLIEIVADLPKGYTGKIHKHAVREWYRQGPERLPWVQAP